MTSNSSHRNTQFRTSEFFVQLLQKKGCSTYYELLRGHVSAAPKDVKEFVRHKCKGENLLQFFKKRRNIYKVDEDDSIDLKGNNRKRVVEISSSSDEIAEDVSYHRKKRSKKKVSSELYGLKTTCTEKNVQYTTSITEPHKPSGNTFRFTTGNNNQLPSASSSDENDRELESALNYFRSLVQYQPVNMDDIKYESLPNYVKDYLKQKYITNKIQRFIYDHSDIFSVNSDYFISLKKECDTEEDPDLSSNESDDEYYCSSSNRASVSSDFPSSHQGNISISSDLPFRHHNRLSFCSDPSERISVSSDVTSVQQEKKTAVPRKRKKKNSTARSSEPSKVQYLAEEIQTVEYFVGILEQKPNRTFAFRKLHGCVSQAPIKVANFFKLHYKGQMIKKLFINHPRIFSLCNMNVSLNKNYAMQLTLLKNLMMESLDNEQAKGNSPEKTVKQSFCEPLIPNQNPLMKNKTSPSISMWTTDKPDEINSSDKCLEAKGAKLLDKSESVGGYNYFLLTFPCDSPCEAYNNDVATILWTLDLFCFEQFEIKSVFERNVDIEVAQYIASELVRTPYQQMSLTRIRQKLGEHELSHFFHKVHFGLDGFRNFLSDRRDFFVSGDTVTLTELRSSTSKVDCLLDYMTLNCVYYSKEYFTFFYLHIKALYKFTTFLETKKGATLHRLSEMFMQFEEEEKTILSHIEGELLVHKIENYLKHFPFLFCFTDTLVLRNSSFSTATLFCCIREYFIIALIFNQVGHQQLPESQWNLSITQFVDFPFVLEPYLDMSNFEKRLHMFAYLIEDSKSFLDLDELIIHLVDILASRPYGIRYSELPFLLKTYFKDHKVMVSFMANCIHRPLLLLQGLECSTVVIFSRGRIFLKNSFGLDSLEPIIPIHSENPVGSNSAKDYYTGKKKQVSKAKNYTINGSPLQEVKFSNGSTESLSQFKVSDTCSSGTNRGEDYDQCSVDKIHIEHHNTERITNKGEQKLSKTKKLHEVDKKSFNADKKPVQNAIPLTSDHKCVTENENYLKESNELSKKTIEKQAQKYKRNYSDNECSFADIYFEELQRHNIPTKGAHLTDTKCNIMPIKQCLESDRIIQVKNNCQTTIYDRDDDNSEHENLFTNFPSCFSRFVCRNAPVAETASPCKIDNDFKDPHKIIGLKIPETYEKNASDCVVFQKMKWDNLYDDTSLENLEEEQNMRQNSVTADEHESTSVSGTLSAITYVQKYDEVKNTEVKETFIEQLKTMELSSHALSSPKLKLQFNVEGESAASDSSMLEECQTLTNDETSILQHEKSEADFRKENCSTFNIEENPVGDELDVELNFLKYGAASNYLRVEEDVLLDSYCETIIYDRDEDNGKHGKLLVNFPSGFSRFVCQYTKKSAAKGFSKELMETKCSTTELGNVNSNDLTKDIESFLLKVLKIPVIDRDESDSYDLPQMEKPSHVESFGCTEISKERLFQEKSLKSDGEFISTSTLEDPKHLTRFETSTCFSEETSDKGDDLSGKELIHANGPKGDGFKFGEVMENTHNEIAKVNIPEALPNNCSSLSQLEQFALPKDSLSDTCSFSDVKNTPSLWSSDHDVNESSLRANTNVHKNNPETNVINSVSEPLDTTFPNDSDSVLDGNGSSSFHLKEELADHKKDQLLDDLHGTQSLTMEQNLNMMEGVAPCQDAGSKLDIDIDDTHPDDMEIEVSNNSMGENRLYSNPTSQDKVLPIKFRDDSELATNKHDDMDIDNTSENNEFYSAGKTAGLNDLSHCPIDTESGQTSSQVNKCLHDVEQIKAFNVIYHYPEEDNVEDISLKENEWIGKVPCVSPVVSCSSEDESTLNGDTQSDCTSEYLTAVDSSRYASLEAVASPSMSSDYEDSCPMESSKASISGTDISKEKATTSDHMDTMSPLKNPTSQSLKQMNSGLTSNMNESFRHQVLIPPTYEVEGNIILLTETTCIVDATSPHCQAKLVYCVKGAFHCLQHALCDNCCFCLLSLRDRVTCTILRGSDNDDKLLVAYRFTQCLNTAERLNRSQNLSSNLVDTHCGFSRSVNNVSDASFATDSTTIIHCDASSGTHTETSDTACQTYSTGQVYYQQVLDLEALQHDK